MSWKSTLWKYTKKIGIGVAKGLVIPYLIDKYVTRRAMGISADTIRGLLEGATDPNDKMQQQINKVLKDKGVVLSAEQRTRQLREDLEQRIAESGERWKK